MRKGTTQSQESREQGSSGAILETGYRAEDGAVHGGAHKGTETGFAHTLHIHLYLPLPANKVNSGQQGKLLPYVGFPRRKIYPLSLSPSLCMGSKLLANVALLR